MAEAIGTGGEILIYEKLVCRDFRHTTQHGAIEGKTQQKDVKYYNLDVIELSQVATLKKFGNSEFSIKPTNMHSHAGAWERGQSQS